MLEITETKLGQALVLGVKGRLDVGTSKILEDKLLQVMAAGETRVVLDCSELDYISSSGLQVLLLAAIRAKDSNRRMVLSSLRPQVKKVFDYAGFTEVFQIYGSQEEAINSFPAHAS